MNMQDITYINIESQTINYIKNPEKFKEDLQIALIEGKATGRTGEVRQAKVILNVIDSRLQIAENQDEIAVAFEGVSKDLGYKVKVIYTNPSNSPQLIGVDERRRNQ